MPYQDLSFNGDTHMNAEFLKLKEKWNITTAIETGSCFYSTTQWLGENFDNVYTVEINADFAKFGIHKVKDMKNVRTYIEDSVIFLSCMYANITQNERCLVFLDAHWNNHCPLLEELEQLCNLKTKQPPVIAIHDFYTGDPNLGFDEYEGQPFTYEWIKQSIEKLELTFSCKYEHYYNVDAVGAKRGVIYLEPITDKNVCYG